jgi:hypothetical protein
VSCSSGETTGSILMEFFCSTSHNSHSIFLMLLSLSPFSLSCLSLYCPQSPCILLSSPFPLSFFILLPKDLTHHHNHKSLSQYMMTVNHKSASSSLEYKYFLDNSQPPMFPQKSLTLPTITFYHSQVKLIALA